MIENNAVVLGRSSPPKARRGADQEVVQLGYKHQTLPDLNLINNGIILEEILLEREVRSACTDRSAVYLHTIAVSNLIIVLSLPL